MSQKVNFEPTEKQFGPFWKYIVQQEVTDIDYNGKRLWITDLKKGRYCANEDISERFIVQFTHDIANCINKPFNSANKVLEADTRELRISIVHDSVAVSGVSVCIRKSPPVLRNTIASMIATEYCSEEILNLLINCVLAKMNFVFAGEPNTGKTECAKFFMQFIPDNERVITIEDSLELHYGEINPTSDHVELRIEKGFSYTDAIKTCLRQNPKWLMLSEARSVEVTSLLEQWSTGVNGFSTIHLDDLHKLPDRILNMMNDVGDALRMENRIYEFVNIGILIRCIKREDGSLYRYIDQLCFYSREKEVNRIHMVVSDGKTISRELPEEIIEKLKRAHISDPFACGDLKKWNRGGRKCYET